MVILSKEIFNFSFYNATGMFVIMEDVSSLFDHLQILATYESVI